MQNEKINKKQKNNLNPLINYILFIQKKQNFRKLVVIVVVEEINNWCI